MIINRRQFVTLATSIVGLFSFRKLKANEKVEPDFYMITDHWSLHKKDYPPYGKTNAHLLCVYKHGNPGGPVAHYSTQSKMIANLDSYSFDSLDELNEMIEFLRKEQWKVMSFDDFYEIRKDWE